MAEDREKEIVNELEIIVGKFKHKYSPNGIMYVGYYKYPELKSYPNFKIQCYCSVHGNDFEKFVGNMENCDLLFAPKRIILKRASEKFLLSKQSLLPLDDFEFDELCGIIEDYNKEIS